MKIILEGQYKYSLFKEFTDDFGKPKALGQELLAELMSPFKKGA